MRSSSAVVCALSAILCVQSASALTVFDTFGPLPQATFGGTGIPNDEVAQGMQIVDGDITITIALSATQRFSNPALTNDGAGTYFATPGSNFGGNGESSNEGALWNFNYYMDVDGNDKVLQDYQIDFYYDFDPGADTPLVDLGKIDITAGLVLASDTSSDLQQGSQNLLFGFLASDAPPVIDAPSGSFDPNAAGEYSFFITISEPGGFPVESVGINVVVVPEPGSLALMGLGALLLTRRRRG